LISILLTLYTPDLGNELTREFEAKDYPSWCSQLRRVLLGHETTREAVVQGVIAEQCIRSPNRVRRYKGFQVLYLSDSTLTEGIGIENGVCVPASGRELLFALLTAQGDKVENLFRLCLNWQSSNIFLTTAPLTISTLERLLPAALRVESKGRSENVAWAREILLKTAPGALIVCGLQGATLGSTWRYDIVCRSSIFSKLIDAIALTPPHR
jgi:hypothetical protein